MLKNIFDRDTLLERVQGDEALVKELLEMFLEDVSARLITLKQAQESGDMKTITLEAHTIKGSSGNISANDMSAAALQIEMAGKEENRQVIPSLIQKLEADFEAFRQALESTGS